MFSAERLEQSVTEKFARLSRPAAIDAALVAAVAGSVAVVTSLYGAYDVDVWAPVGLILVSTAAALLAAGRRPPGAVAVAAAGLVALGAWSVASTAWGGLPQEAWLKFDQGVVAAAALVVGSCLTAKPGRRGLMLSAVLLGITLHALIVMVRLAADAHPEAWLQRRFLQGPVGYHNAQGLLFALAIPLALWVTDHERMAARVLGGASAGILAAGLLLTQSRGALLGLGVGVAFQLAWARRISLLLPATALVAVMAGLFFALREVDDALLTSASPAALEALRHYLLAATAAAVVLGTAAALAHSRVVRRSTAMGLVVLLAGTAAAIVVHERTALFTARFSLPGLPADENVTTPAGTTRIPTLAPNGRRDAWRVARSMAAEKPLLGSGQGQFARRWTEERNIRLYIRQPHSIELELLAELGAVGLALFAAFVGAVAFSLVRTSRRTIGAAAMGTGAVLLVDASLDWTWSFPGIVLPTLLVMGAAVGSRALSIPGRLTTGAIVLATFALGFAIALPYVADRHVEHARELLTTEGGGAWSELETARKLDPWNAEALSLEGVIAAQSGRYALAVDRFRAAEANTDSPWLEHYREAGALARSGRYAAARAACEQAVAANPAERRLYEGPCSYDDAGNAWPVVKANAPTTPLNSEFSGFYVDKSCGGCVVRFSASELVASTLGATDSRDTAYAVLKVTQPDSKRMLVVSDVLRLPAERRIETHVAVLEVRDIQRRLVYELYVDGRDSTIGFYSPSGGLRANELNKNTGVALEPGGPSRTVEITSIRDHSVSVRVDGVERLRFTLSGATTGDAALVRAGVIARTGWSPNAPLRIAHDGLTASAVEAVAG